MIMSTIRNGRPVLMVAALSAVRPPPINNMAATTPSVTAQKIRCLTGGSRLPPAVIISITSEPESDKVRFYNI